MKKLLGTILALNLALLGSGWEDRALAQPGMLATAYDYAIAFTYVDQVISPDSEVSLEITLQNLGLRGDTFDIEVIESPQGWSTEITRFNTVLSGIYLGAEENASLNLQAWPPEGEDIIKEGRYPLAVRVRSRTGQKTVESRTVLKVVAEKRSRQALTISTAYPEISGPSDSRFAFSLDIKNNAAEDALVNLIADTPQNWEASFKPGYEEKQISSIQVPKGQSRSVTLDINPAYQAEVGSYPLTVKAETPAGSAEAQLTINLTGTYKIRAVTANELLSMATEVGQPITVSLYILNEGSAGQKEITFMAVKPDNWQVEFKPEKLNDLAGRSSPTLVEMTVTPAPNALVGDYGLGVSIQGEKAQSNLDFRVTVRANAAWTWVGAALIVLVVGALGYTFRKLGRR
ncbi:MAG: hypothetical protein LBP22_16255 [Deltaproteobacteria bacterium]|jgi:uncharacterized membrane protein|nr:hypothetical protein [Deltaproteobacteria bacterium]